MVANTKLSGRIYRIIISIIIIIIVGPSWNLFVTYHNLILPPKKQYYLLLLLLQRSYISTKNKENTQLWKH